MGFDVTLHCASQQDIEQIVSLIEDPAKLDQFSGDYNLNTQQKELAQSILDDAANMQADGQFNSTHGYAMAAIAGIIRPYWYIRGAAISLCDDETIFAPYITPWRDMLTGRLTSANAADGFAGNYVVGAHLSHDGITRLKETYKEEAQASGGVATFETTPISYALNAIFSHDRFDVFREAMEYALENDMGIFEATDLFCPHPFEDAGEYTTYSGNNRGKGVDLFREAAAEQMAAAVEQAQAADAGTPAPSEKRPGFFARLFGRS